MVTDSLQELTVIIFDEKQALCGFNAPLTAVNGNNTNRNHLDAIIHVGHYLFHMRLFNADEEGWNMTLNWKVYAQSGVNFTYYTICRFYIFV